MKKTRVILDLTVLASTTALLTFIANFKFTGIANETATNVSLQLMHVSLIAACLVNCIDAFSRKDIRTFIIAILPALALVAAIILSLAAGFAFPGVALILFDFYLIYAFFWLFLGELKRD